MATLGLRGSVKSSAPPTTLPHHAEQARKVTLTPVMREVIDEAAEEAIIRFIEDEAPQSEAVAEAERLRSKYENALSPEEREKAKHELNMFALRHVPKHVPAPSAHATAQSTPAKPLSKRRGRRSQIPHPLKPFEIIGRKSIEYNNLFQKFLQSKQFNDAVDTIVRDTQLPREIAEESLVNAELAFAAPIEGAMKFGKYLSHKGFGSHDFTSSGSLLSTLAPSVRRAQKVAKGVA